MHEKVDDNDDDDDAKNVDCLRVLLSGDDVHVCMQR